MVGGVCGARIHIYIHIQKERTKQGEVRGYPFIRKRKNVKQNVAKKQGILITAGRITGTEMISVIGNVW